MPYEIEMQEHAYADDEEGMTPIGGLVTMNGVQYRLISADIYGRRLFRQTGGES